MTTYKIKFISGGKMRVTAKTEFLAKLYASRYGTIASCEKTVSRWWYLIYAVCFLIGWFGARML